jgi:hypothetical protein
MARAHRMSIAGGVIVGLLSTQSMLFASEATAAAADATTTAPIAIDQPQTRPSLFTFAAALPTTRPLFTPMPPEFSAATAQIYRGRSYRSRHRDGSVAAMIIGSAAVIAGTAVLVYAHRPECSAGQNAGGCGYGTRVVGTSVLVGGAVGLFVGAITW